MERAGEVALDSKREKRCIVQASGRACRLVLSGQLVSAVEASYSNTVQARLRRSSHGLLAHSTTRFIQNFP